MRVLRRHLKALERQIQEKALLVQASEVRAECLNLKLEWAGSKIPGLSVSNPKGLLHSTDSGDEDQEVAEA